MIFLWTILTITIFSVDFTNASVSFTPDWEKIAGKTLPDARFTDVKGNSVQLSDYKDKILILHPMFTHCPSTCTFISSRLSKAINSLLPNERRNLQVVSFSFDPKETSEGIEKFEKMFQIDPSFWKIVRGDGVIVQRLLTALDYRTLQLSASNYEHPNLVFVVGKNGILQDYIYGSDLTSDRLRGVLRSAQGEYSELAALKSYLYIFALIGLLISTFVAAAHFTKAYRHSS